MDSNHRRHRQQIYSLSPLATREFPQYLSHCTPYLFKCQVLGYLSFRSFIRKPLILWVLFYGMEGNCICRLIVFFLWRIDVGENPDRMIAGYKDTGFCNMAALFINIFCGSTFRTILTMPGLRIYNRQVLQHRCHQIKPPYCMSKLIQFFLGCYLFLHLLQMPEYQHFLKRQMHPCMGGYRYFLHPGRDYLNFYRNS